MILKPELPITVSVSVVDLNQGIQIKDIEVGLHPSGMVLSPDHTRLYVACANSDIISVINTGTDEVIEEISVHMGKNLPFGSAPNAIDNFSGWETFFMLQMAQIMPFVLYKSAYPIGLLAIFPPAGIPDRLSWMRKQTLCMWQM